MKSKIMAGTACTDITPPLGHLLQGHASRNKPSEKVHDPLNLKALSLSKGPDRIVLVSCDLLCFTKDFVASARKEITRRTGLLPNHVLICASHAHTGPVMLDLLETRPEDFVPGYFDALTEKMASAVGEAVKAEEPVGVKYGCREIDMGILNRRRKKTDGTVGGPDPEGPVDYEVRVLSFEKDSGEPLAVLFNYACHPTTLSSKIFQVSGDYPGAAQREVEKFYPGAAAIFTNGCFGDVRPGLLDESGEKFRGGDFGDVLRMGRLLASGVIHARETAVEISVEKLEGKLEEFSFPLDKRFFFKDKETFEKIFPLLLQKFKKRKEPSDAELHWKEFWLKNLRNNEEVTCFIKRDIQVLKIGDIALIGIPGEPVVDIGLKIKKRLGGVIPIGQSNGFLSYLPTAAVIEEGGYEASLFFYLEHPGPFAPDMEQKFLDKIFSMAGK